MVGFVIGLSRLILVTIYRKPLCGVEDLRPMIVKIHFLYFALALFLVTAVLIIVISSLTKPGESWRTIRTVFWQRFVTTVRPDELKHVKQAMREEIEMHTTTAAKVGSEIDAIEIERGEGKKRPSKCKQLFVRAFEWFCGFSWNKTERPVEGDTNLPGLVPLLAEDTHDAGHTAEEYVANLVESIKQSPRSKLILNLNLGIILSIVIFFCIFFSLPVSFIFGDLK